MEERRIESAEESYVVAGCRPWSRQVYQESITLLPGRWTYVGRPEELTRELLRRHKPRYVFFLHWSSIVPDDVVSEYECVCFHMTDVPYGRGGSPLQNLILRGHRRTKLSALRMTEELDAGPVYVKEELTLEGSAEEIYKRANRLAARMIERIIRERPEPVPQQGPAVIFKRRRPEESLIPRLDSTEELYDFIRMLDADGYPHAFLTHSGHRFEFTDAVLEDGRIAARVTITSTAD